MEPNRPSPGLWLLGAILLGIVMDARAAESLTEAEELAAAEAEAKNKVFSMASGACSPSEKWSFGEDVRAKWRKEFEGLVSRKYSPARGLANALALRSRSITEPELKALAEYWVARSLYESRMVHVAHSAFHSLALQPPRRAIRGVQIAALECLNAIQARNPTLAHSPELQSRLPQYAADAAKLGPNQREAVNYALTQYVRRLADEGRSKNELKAALEPLKGQGTHEALAKLFVAAKQSDHLAAINEGQRFLSAPAPAAYKRFVDTAHLLLARSFYSVDNFDAAASHLKLVSKSSNELAHALQEMTWAFLQAEKYPEAIGTAMNLSQGGLRNTYAPEAPMVMAMALNEICQFPSSLGAIGMFRKRYEKAYRWLDHYARQPADASQTLLYKEAARFLARNKDAPSEVPSAIGTEWVRSPFFIAHQDEINLLFDTRESAKRGSQSAAQEQERMAKAIIADWRQVKHNIQEAKKKMKPGETLPARVRTQIADLRYDIEIFKRLWNAAPAWSAITERHFERAPAMERRLVEAINRNISERTIAMHTQLQEIAENNQLIEVEIYNGASQDIIWQNAHPEYKAVAKELTEESRRKSADKVWDWGRAPARAEDVQGGEIWEDELGSFRAEMVNNCESKDKYLSLVRAKK